MMAMFFVTDLRQVPSGWRKERARLKVVARGYPDQ